MKRPRTEDGNAFQFLPQKPLISSEDPDLTLKLKNTHITAGVPHYEFEMRHSFESCTLRIGDPSDPYIQKAGHLGYMVRTPERGNKYAQKACKVLLPLAAQHGLTELQIVTAASNLASIRTCEQLGAKLIEEYDAPFNGTTQTRKRYQLLVLDATSPVPGHNECDAIETEFVDSSSEDTVKSPKKKMKKM